MKTLSNVYLNGLHNVEIKTFLLGGPMVKTKAEQFAARLGHKANRKSIKLQFLPANATSKLQAVDLGINKNFKHFYRGGPNFNRRS